MSFMIAQLTERQEWYMVDGQFGTEYIPYELVMDDLDSLTDYSVQVGHPGTTIQIVSGYGVRLSAPGYLDCTEWEVYDEPEDAMNRFQELKAEHTEVEYH